MGTLTVSLTDLSLDPVAGCRVTIDLIRYGVGSGSISIPTVDLQEITDESGEALFEIGQNQPGSIYQAKVFNVSGRKVLDATFDMPDDDANLADLLDPDQAQEPAYPMILRVKDVAGTSHTLGATDLNYDVLVFNSASLVTIYLPAPSELNPIRGTKIGARNRGGGGIKYQLTSAAVAASMTLEGAGDEATADYGRLLSTVYLEAPGARWVTIGALWWPE
jgi:hypothetical protein